MMEFKTLMTCKYCNKLIDESTMACPCWEEGTKERRMKFLAFGSEEEYYKALNDGYYIDKDDDDE